MIPSCEISFFTNMVRSSFAESAKFQLVPVKEPHTKSCNHFSLVIHHSTILEMFELSWGTAAAEKNAILEVPYQVKCKWWPNTGKTENNICRSMKLMIERLTDFKATVNHNCHPDLSTHKSTLQNLENCKIFWKRIMVQLPITRRIISVSWKR